ncbi:MAG: hypothetical protein AAGF31_06780 [Planctomycetota bacterium]
MTSRATPADMPLDQAGSGGGWIVIKFLLHAVSGVFSGRVLFLATLGLLAAELAVWATFGFNSSRAAPLLLSATAADPYQSDPAALLAAASQNQVGYWRSFVSPFIATPSSLAGGLQQYAAGGLRLAVWSLFGVAIARLAALHMTYNQRPSARSVLRRSLSGWVGQAAGPLVLLAVVGTLVGVLWMLGAVSHARILGIITFPLIGLIAIVAALLGLGLAIGTPLIWASHAAERPDAFDAVSCGFAYVYQRPLRLVAYTLQAWGVGVVAGAILLLVAQWCVRFLLVWLTGFGKPVDDSSEPYLAMVFDSWVWLFGYAPLVFHAAYFWFATVAIYLLLRRDIDEKQCDEVFLEELYAEGSESPSAESSSAEAASSETAADSAPDA